MLVLRQLGLGLGGEDSDRRHYGDHELWCYSRPTAAHGMARTLPPPSRPTSPTLSPTPLTLLLLLLTLSTPLSSLLLTQLLYEDYAWVCLDQPYMPGYLAFREVGFFAALVEHLQVLQVVDDDDSE